MSMNTTDKAIDRIKKLLALAESSNAYEAAQAMGRAQELMTKHRIDAAQVQDSEDAAPIEAVQDDVLFAIIGRQRVVWKGRLARGLADANGVHVYWSWTDDGGRYTRCLKAVGQPSVVRVAAFAFQFVVAEIDRLTRIHGRGQGRTWQNNLRLGAVEAVVEKVEQQVEQDLGPEVEGEEGLVPTNALQAIAKEVERQVKDLGLVRVSSGGARYNYGARAAGERAGANIEVRNGARGLLTA